MNQAGSPFFLTSDVVVPMEGNVIIRDGGVAVEAERIVGVGTMSDLRQKFGELPREHVAGVMLPGFVNAHVHLELGYQRAAGQREWARYAEWVWALMKHYPEPSEMEKAVEQATCAGAAESLAAGVTCVGDISRQCEITRRELAGGPLRVVSFGEVVGLGKMRGRLERLLETAADRSLASKSLTAGVSPHAPYTVEGPSLETVVRRAMKENMPIAMHLAEHLEEELFLQDLSGPLGREWDVMLQMDLLDDAIPTFPGGPLEWAVRWQLLGENGVARLLPVVLAHVNYCNDSGLAILATSKASVAYCPRTRAYFGHDKVRAHRSREMLEAGVNVCLGTDSLASNPDLSVLREAQLLWRRDGLPARLAMEMITWRGAKALGIEAGRLTAGRWADVVVLPVDIRGEDSVEKVLGRVLAAAPGARAVWVGGRRAL